MHLAEGTEQMRPQRIISSLCPSFPLRALREPSYLVLSHVNREIGQFQFSNPIMRLASRKEHRAKETAENNLLSESSFPLRTLREPPITELFIQQLILFILIFNVDSSFPQYLILLE